jgi:hypothetical protein
MFSELFQLYSFKEKGVTPETGGFYDQPAAYIEAMGILDSAISDSMDPNRSKNMVSPEDDKKLDGLKSLGIPITEKK